MNKFLERVKLTGTHVQMEPLSLDNIEALCDVSRDGELWKLWYTLVPTPEKMRADVEARLERYSKGISVPFVVRRLSDQRIVGATTYHDVDAVNRRLEIGYTYTALSSQRSAVNSESKLLLLTDAFERLDCLAVEFRTHWMNRQSRAAIERLGAKLDGVLRAHMIGRTGELRDTCVYSITAPEWSTVKAGLAHRLLPSASA